MRALVSLIVLLAAWLVLPIPVAAQQSTRCDAPRAESEPPSTAAGAAFARANEHAAADNHEEALAGYEEACLLYTSPSPRD